ncbi:anti-sigma factor family protein [Streptomyces sp. NPDC048590]|uniref:anti-sigma factor family protein n=1 Tax=Streptomyces sp. NPDC048590 TaxID=3365574 RepID=UPI0037179A5B
MNDDEWEAFGHRPAGPRVPADPPGRPPGFPPGEPGHDGAAGYALGILDDAEARAFEAHLDGCARCAAHLDEFAGMEPLLAALAGTPEAVPRAPVTPAPRMLDGLVDEVARKRSRRRRRARYLVAAAAVLVIGGPVAAVTATGGDESGRRTEAADPHPTSPAEDAFFHHMEEKRQATDPVTRVDATVGLEAKTWGTHTVLELKNVSGPRKCSLVAVSKAGDEEVVTSWSVPKWGYGIQGSAHESGQHPLYVHGGTAMARGEIDHFEVRTFDGERLVEIDA